MAPLTNENRPLAPPVRGGRRGSASDDDLDPGRDISDDDDDDFEGDDTSDSDEDDSDLEIPPIPFMNKGWKTYDESMHFFCM